MLTDIAMNKGRDIRLTYSFFLLEGRVGTNLSFCAPCRVISVCFFARLLIALEGERLVNELDPAGSSVEKFVTRQIAPFKDLITRTMPRHICG